MVPQPSTEQSDSSFSRRECLAAGLATVSLASIPTVGAQSDAEPPGVVQRRVYENLRVTGTAEAHGSGRVLVGRVNPRPDPDDPVWVALTDATGGIRQRASFVSGLPEEAHALPDVARTEDGYAVAAGPWLARLDSDLSLRTTGKHGGDIGAARETQLVSTTDGFVAGVTEWLPNAFWTWLVGFDADGAYRWHREVDTNGSQALEFLLPHGDGVLAGGTFPWLRAFDADGSSRQVDLPDDLPDAALNAAVRDGEGLVLCSGNGAARLDSSYELDWTREYDALGEEYADDITPTSDGGYLFRTTPVETGDLTLAKADADGELQWHHSYRVGTETAAEIHTLTELSPGEYLLAGGANRSMDGWAIEFSATETPTPGPTATPAPTATPDSTPTTTAPAPTDTRTGPASTTTTGSGFGIVAAGAALAGTIAATLRRADD
jgi:hypothetical protein